MAGKTAKTAQAAPKQDTEQNDPLEDVLKSVSEAFDEAGDATNEGPEESPLDADTAKEEANSAETALLAARVDELEAKVDALKDRLLRAMADAENTRRRAERDKSDALAFGGAKLAKDLLPVQDNLDRALKAADDGLRETAKDFIEGVELTKREILSAFSKHAIEPVAPELGAKFDPNLHQAMFEAPVPGAKAGTVIEVIQTGFTISGRLLRPALVGVAKAVAEKPQEEKPARS